MNLVSWFRWVRAWTYIWCVHFWEWRIFKSANEADEKILAILNEAIQEHKPDVEILRAGVCENCRTSERIIVKTNATQPLPHDFLCAECWLGRLIQEMN